MHGLRGLNTSSSKLVEVSLGEISLKQMNLLQEQRDELEQKLERQSEKDDRISDLRDDKRHLESELRREQDRLREKWHEKEQLEVDLLREKLVTERHARSYHQLEGLVRKRDTIERQLSDSRRRLAQSPVLDYSKTITSSHSVAVGTLPLPTLSKPVLTSMVPSHKDTSFLSLADTGTKNTLSQRVFSLETEMGNVMRDIDYKLKSRDMNIQVGDACIPIELYKRKEMVGGLGGSAASHYTTLCCGCRIEGFGRDARIPCPYHSAVENLRSHLSKQQASPLSALGKKKSVLSTGAYK